MSTIVYTDPPDEAQRIEMLFVWIGVHANGGEGILSADLPVLPGGEVRHIPLMSSKRELAERLQPVARQVQRAAMHQADRFVKIELREFRVVVTS